MYETVLCILQALRDMTPVDNCPSGKRALNKEKNRYRNVLPCKLFHMRLVSTGPLCPLESKK
jgi:hypothetical protein